MPVLPASVRLAVWVTSAWAEGTDPGLAAHRALPDVDHVDGDLDRLSLWRDLGEQALLVALPSPGDLTGLPGASTEVRGAAAVVGECVYVPGLGGMLVPVIELYGPVGDQGTRVGWTAYDAAPVPRHRIEALDPSPLERRLREELAELTPQIEATGGRPFAAAAARELAESALGGRWGLPGGLPPRAERVMALAGTVGVIADVALGHPEDALDATTALRRRGLLRRLQRTADQVLADATNAACAVVAGWRPA